MIPKIGLNISPVRPEQAVAAAQLAERLGFESVWAGEIVVSPFERQSAYHNDKPPFRADSDFVEPFVLLAAIASATESIRLGTGVVVLPVRDPFLTARAIVTLDRLSGGRFELGAGVGWMRDQSDILRADFSQRGAVMEEFLDVLEQLFTEPRPEYHGRHFDFPPVGFEPKPSSMPRLWLGGTSQAALSRAARRGDGYYGAAATPAAAADLLARLRELRSDQNVDGTFALSLIAMSAPSAADLEGYGGVGVERVVVTPWARRDDGTPRGRITLDSIDQYATDVLAALKSDA